MSAIRTIPFSIDHLMAMKPDARHGQAVDMAMADTTVQRAMVNPYGVTFVDARTRQVLGCAGILRGSAECWAILDHHVLSQQCYVDRAAAIVRSFGRVLQEFQDKYNSPVYARVDGTSRKDSAVLRTLGFKDLENGWYQRGDYEERGRKVDIAV